MVLKRVSPVWQLPCWAANLSRWLHILTNASPSCHAIMLPFLHMERLRSRKHRSKRLSGPVAAVDTQTVLHRINACHERPHAGLAAGGEQHP